MRRGGSPTAGSPPSARPASAAPLPAPQPPRRASSREHLTLCACASPTHPPVGISLCTTPLPAVIHWHHPEFRLPWFPAESASDRPGKPRNGNHEQGRVALHRRGGPAAYCSPLWWKPPSSTYVTVSKPLSNTTHPPRQAGQDLLWRHAHVRVATQRSFCRCYCSPVRVVWSPHRLPGPVGHRPCSRQSGHTQDTGDLEPVQPNSPGRPRRTHLSGRA